VAEHANLAREYEDRTRKLATSPELWNTWYFDHLRLALSELKADWPDRRLLALDALGGTGKTALFLQQHGADVVLNDVSPEMTAVYRRIAGELGLPAEVALAPIEAYLDLESTPQFSLITASSALHHLQDYEHVLRQFYEHLEPGGFVHTAWDPLPRSKVVRTLGKAEYYLTLARRPRAMARGLRNRIRRRVAARDTAEAIDHEFHKAIDDAELLRTAQAIGFAVRAHHRNAGGALRVTKPLWRLFGAHTTFALLLQRPAD
jgi:SAM-dependent methyltransferase